MMCFYRFYHYFRQTATLIGEHLLFRANCTYVIKLSNETWGKCAFNMYIYVHMYKMYITITKLNTTILLCSIVVSAVRLDAVMICIVALFHLILPLTGSCFCCSLSLLWHAISGGNHLLRTDVLPALYDVSGMQFLYDFQFLKWSLPFFYS